MIVVLIALLGGCGRADPQLVAVREALEAWDDGMEALEGGDPVAAAASFQQAHTHRPDDVLLVAWHAHALAESGDLEGALDRLDAALAAQPMFAEARYNRAAYSARLGLPPATWAADLKQAVDDGAARSREVLADPDFADVLDDPALGWLPDAALTVAVEAPQGTVFWGSEFAIRFRMAGAEDDPIGVTAEASSGPVQLMAVVDDSNPSTQGVFRDLTWTFRVVGAGPVQFGPFQVWVGDRRTTVDPIVLEAAAPDGKETPPPGLAPARFNTPIEVAARGTAPSARVVDGALLVMYQPGDRVVLEPTPAVEPVHYELRQRSRVEWVLDRYPGVDPDSVRVQVLRGGVAVFDEPVGAGAG